MSKSHLAAGADPAAHPNGNGSSSTGEGGADHKAPGGPGRDSKPSQAGESSAAGAGAGDAPPPYSTAPSPLASLQPHPSELPPAHPLLHTAPHAHAHRYADPESPLPSPAEAYAAARSRALRRFWGAFLIGWGIYIALGLVVGGMAGAEMADGGGHGHGHEHRHGGYGVLRMIGMGGEEETRWAAQ